MLSFSFFIAILCIFALKTSAQLSQNFIKRERFNVTLQELNEQCNHNGENFQNLLFDLMVFRNFRNDLLGQLNAASFGSPAEGDYRSVHLISQLCESNPEMINRLYQLIKGVQNCLKEENRLRQDEEQKILENMLSGVCLQLEFERALFTQPECLTESMASLHSPIDECSLSYPHFRTVYTLEPIPIIYSEKECSDFINAGECRINNRINCDDNLKIIIKHRFDMALGLIYCDTSASRYLQNNFLRYL